MERRGKGLPRYEQISLMIACDIATGVYREGQRISGRSILAGKYKVSPETVRKAISLLQLHHVVNAVPGSGVLIMSRLSAQSYIGVFQEYKTLELLEQRLDLLIEKRNEINYEIETIVKDILKYKMKTFKDEPNHPIELVKEEQR